MHSVFVDKVNQMEDGQFRQEFPSPEKPQLDIFLWSGGRAAVEGGEAVGGEAEGVHGLGNGGGRPRLLRIRSQAGADAAGEDPSLHRHLQEPWHEGDDVVSPGLGMI